MIRVFVVCVCDTYTLTGGLFTGFDVRVWVCMCAGVVCVCVCVCVCVRVNGERDRALVAVCSNHSHYVIRVVPDVPMATQHLAIEIRLIKSPQMWEREREREKERRVCM